MSQDRVPTPSQTVGPFFGYALPFEDGHDAAIGQVAIRQPAVRIEGQVLDGAGEPVPDALVELWTGQQFGRCRTDSEGLYHFIVVKPVPGDGAPCLELSIFARGLLRHVATRMYFPDEEAANASDPVLQLIDPARRQTLIAHSEGAVLRFDIRLQGISETVFFAL